MKNFFSERRFGLFIHWGIYALGEWHEQERGRLGIPRKEYEKRAENFNPLKFDADSWVRTACGCGMKYICFTAKHHDGFCMWDTKQTDFKVTNTPFGRDVLYELSEACAKRDMGLCIYYSNPDWHHPNAYNPYSSHQLLPEPGDIPDMEKYKEYIKAQVTELLTGYGKILSLFWDIPPHIYDPSVNELVRKLQPDIMINDRGFSEGDYSTPERSIPETRVFTGPVEACQSVGQESWGCRVHEHYFTRGFLTRSIDSVMARGGNYLLNAGPRADGTLGESEKILLAAGDWYKRVRESFEGAEVISDYDEPDYLFTGKGNKLYLHFRKPLETSGMNIASLAERPPRRVYVLNDGTELKFAVEKTPWLWNLMEDRKSKCLNIWGIPEYPSEAVIIVLEY